MSAGAKIRVAVDIGGTFTDVVAQCADATLHYLKVPSTPSDPAEAVIAGLVELIAGLELTSSGSAEGELGGLEVVSEIIHGTTVGSNTLLQKSGARTGVLTTRGFRDVLEIGRIRTPAMFDLSWRKPEPLAARRHRLEVSERIAADGSIVTPLDEDAVREAGARSLAEGVEALAICFLNSYANPVHERRARDILAAEFPSLRSSASCDVLPEIKEYERTSTTVVNAYLLKAMRGYLERLLEGLAAAGLRAPVRVVTSQGGMISAEAAAVRPVLVVGSGPAGGVIGGAQLAAPLAAEDLIVFDLGGTTAKASLVESGRPALTTEVEFRDGISSPSRFIKGGGYVLKVPAIDIAEVGAGGGSIAWVDEGGLLRVGPRSAGADPGPACYGRGNEAPTLTDANVVLGLLNPRALVGGSLGIDPELALTAITRHIAEPLGLEPLAAAAGVRRIANLEMARAIRSVTIERGRDPREMTLLAAGGGGPVHAGELAQILDIGRVVVAPASGVFCSLGMLSADTTHSLVRTAPLTLEQYDEQGLDEPMSALREEAAQRMRAEMVDPNQVDFEFSVDVRYVGQSSELTVALREDDRSGEVVYRDFIEIYHRTFGHATDEAVEIVNLRLLARARHPNVLRFGDLEALAPRPASSERAGSVSNPSKPCLRTAVIGVDDVAAEVPVYARDHMPDGVITGPAIIEAYDTTIVVPANALASSHSTGAIIIEVGGA